jgi:hypothetical protein
MDFAASIGDINVPFIRGWRYSEQATVLVTNIKNVKSVEKVVPSVVWFEACDPLNGTGIKHLYFSLDIAVCKVVETPSEWK